MKLAQKLFFLFSIGSIVGIFAIGFVSFIFTSQALKQSIVSQQLQLADQTMDKIDRLLYERYNDMQTISSDQTIKGFISAFADKATPQEGISQLVKKRVNELSISTGPWDNIELIDTTGIIRYSLNSDEIGKSIGGNSQSNTFFQNALLGITSYSDAFVSSDIKRPTMLFAIPIIDDNDPSRRVIGVVITNLSWPIISEVLQSINGPTLDLYNRNFIEIANTDDDSVIFKEKNKSSLLQLAQKEGQASGTINDEGGKSVVSSEVLEKGFLTYKGNGWLLLLKQPTGVAFAPATQSAIITSAILSPVVLLIIGIFFLIVLRLLRPIQGLIDATQDIASGNLSKRVSVNSKDELGILASTFNSMADAVQKLNLELEEKVKDSVSKVVDLENTKKAMLNVMEDLQTEKSIGEQERIKLQASVNSLSVGFIMVDTNNTIITINESGRNMLCSIKAISSSSHVCTMEDIETELIEFTDLRALIKNSIESKKVLFVKEVPLRNSFLKLAISPILQGDKAIGAVVLADDITEAKILDRSKDEFFSIASHELRTPLTAIRGNISLIKQFYGDKLQDKELVAMVDDIHESTVRLISIVNDFLDTSRLELGKMQFKKESVNLAELIDSVIRQYQVTGSRKKLYIHFEAPENKTPDVVGDDSRIRQVLINLIGNGLKFTEEGGITISLKQEANSVSLFVSDTGKGIPLQNQSLLFHKFQQAGRSIFTRDAVLGTGLGLYISKMMIEGMGGKIKLDHSEEGKGTTFVFTLPLATEEVQNPIANDNKPNI